jgi:hypothetical protein
MRERVLNNSRMGSEVKGSYFGAAIKFQKASIQTHMQTIIQAFKHSSTQAFDRTKCRQWNLNAKRFSNPIKYP